MLTPVPGNIAARILPATLGSKVCACFSIDQRGVLLSQTGDFRSLGMSSWKLGSNVLAAARFLDGLIPMSGDYEKVSKHVISIGNIVDIHCFEDTDRIWVVLTEAASGIDQRYQSRVFEALNLLVMRRLDEGAFELAVPASQRFAGFYAEALQSSQSLYPQNKFPVVENFLNEAEKIWGQKDNAARKRSGPWVEYLADGEELALEAIALNLDDDKLLLIEIQDENFRLEHEFLQIGRENALLNIKLEQQNAPLKALIENMDQGVHLFDADLRVVIANKNASKYMGLPENFLVPGTSLAEIIEFQYMHDELYDSRDSVEAEIAYWLQYREDAPNSYRYERKRPDGTYLEIRNIRLPDGGWIGTETDITESRQIELIREQNERKLVELNQRLELATSIASLGIWDWDLKNNITRWDSQLYEIFGLPASETITYDKWKSFIHAEDLESAKAAIAKMLESGKEDSLKLRIVRTDGEIRYIHARGGIVYDSDGSPARFVGVNLDITEQVLADRNLENSHNQLQALADNLPEFITLKDVSGRFLFINKRFEEWTHQVPENTVGKTVYDIYPPEQAAKYAELDSRVIESGQIHSEEDDILYPDGKVRTVISTRFPVTSRAGEILGVSTIDHDITESKRMEQMKTEFVSTVSHELRTPMTSIRGALDLIMSDLVGEMPPAAQEMLNIAHNNTERLLLLIDDLLDIQKLESDNLSLNFQKLSMRPFVQQVVADNVGYARDKGVKFTFKKSDLDCDVFADKTRLGQVVSNLLSNAAKFSPDGSIVEVSIALVANRRVRVSVSDSGSGIPDDFKDQIFERFTQSDSSDTRKSGGTGLGLAISRAIIERHNGLLGFDSQMGVGSTFYFELPEHFTSLDHFGETPQSTVQALDRDDENLPREVAQSIAALKSKYVDSLPAKIIEIEDARKDSLEALAAQAHKLAGAAGMYGFHTLSQIAGDLERICDSIIEQNRKPNEDELEQIAGLIQSLHESIPPG